LYPGQLILRDAESLKIVAEAEIPNRPSSSRRSTVFAKMIVMSQDGRTIVPAGQGPPICVWKIEENQRVGTDVASGNHGDAAELPKSKSENDLDRRAAKRIFERGGEVGLGTATSKLKVGGTPVKPIKRLANLPAGPLSIVDVSFFKVRGPVDPDLPLIAHMSRLRRIDLDRTAITDAGVASLKDLKSLEILWLRGTKVSDAGLAHIAGLSNLTFISLDNTAITDDGLKHIEKLGNLRLLNLNSTGVTAEGVKKLQAIIPHCKIAWKFEEANPKREITPSPSAPATIFEAPAAEAPEYDKRRYYAVTLSPDGEIVDTANKAGTLRIRNVVTGEVVKSPIDRPGIEAVAWSPDRSSMVLGLRGSKVEVWKIGDSQPVHSFKMSGSPSIRRVAFSSDGNTVIACGVLGTGKRRLVESWSLAEDSSLGRIDIESNDRLVNQRVFGLDISPDRSLVAIASGHGVQVWSLKNHQLLQTIVTEDVSNFRAVVQTVEFSKDGTRLGLGAYGNLSIVDVASGKVIQRFVVGGKIHSVAFSPDGKSVVSYSLFKAKTNNNGVAEIEERQRFTEWDLTNGKQIREWYYPSWGVARHMTFSSDGRYLVAAGHSFPLRVLEWEKEVPVRMPKATSSSPTSGDSPVSIERRVAERVKMRGGMTDVRFVDGERNLRIHTNTPIPEEPFRVTRIEIRKRRSVSPDDIALFSRLQSPFRMNNYQSGISDTGLALLANNPHLTALVIRDRGRANEGRVTDDGLNSIGTLPNLTMLELNCPMVTDAGVQRLAGLTKLTNVWLTSSNITGRSLDAIGGFTNVDTLRLHEAKIQDDDLANLSGLSKLQLLSLIGTEVHGPGLVHLKDLPKLDVLYLNGSNVTGEGVDAIAGLSQLSTLSLANSTIHDEALERLAAMRGLNSLSLEATPVSDRSLLHLTDFVSLTSLNLGKTRITDESLKVLGSLNQLSSLDLSATGITDDGIPHLTALRQIETLDLNNTRVSDICVPFLIQLSTLRSLNLRKTQVTTEGIEALKNELPKCDVYAGAPPPEAQ
jgi:WD40 repeat protein/Leucine-rich repeat (LRR) protein